MQATPALTFLAAALLLVPVATEYFSNAQQRWLALWEANQTWSFWGLYPSMVLMQDGRLFYTGSHTFGPGLPGGGAETILTSDQEETILAQWQFGLGRVVAQLQHQDPMNPMQDSDFMGQMASFSTLEQVSNLAKANEAIAANLTRSHAVGLIGRTVTWTDADKVAHTGVVEKVTQKDGKPVLTVSGTEGVDPTTITQIA